MGLNGEYDQSGLAKRVAQAFDANPDVADIDTVYVAQLGTTVVLKGTVPSQEIVNRLVTIAKGVKGATGVETNQVTVG
jgi:osmotically-inducible protein OsmY